MSTNLSSRRVAALSLAGALVLALPACNTAQRLSNIGSGPSLAKIEDPQSRPDYKPVSMPMPTPRPSMRNPNSLWRNGARAFFNDQRAAQVGDLLTITVAIADSAALKNTTERDRTSSDSASLPTLPSYAAGGLGRKLAGLGGPLINTGTNTTNYTGNGAVTRSEAITLTLAAVVIQTLQNGNMVIEGKQQVKVNSEMRELTITGIVRPEDIDSTNSITYDKIAEARISYGGQGTVSDVQQPRYGQELLDIILPF